MVTGIHISAFPITPEAAPSGARAHASRNSIAEAHTDAGAVFDAVDLALDLSHGSPRDLLGAAAKLSPADCEAFLKMLAELLQQGVIGTETLDVNGEPYTCYLPARLGDARLMHAKVWRADSPCVLNVIA